MNIHFEYKSPEEIRNIYRYPQYTYEEFSRKYDSIYIPSSVTRTIYDSILLKRQLWIRFLIVSGRLERMMNYLQQYRQEYIQANNENLFDEFMNFRMPIEFNMNGETILHCYVRSNNIRHSLNIGRQLIQWTQYDNYDYESFRCYENIHNKLWFNPFIQFCNPENAFLFFSENPNILYIKNSNYHSINLVVDTINEHYYSQSRNTTFTFGTSVIPRPPNLIRENAITPRGNSLSSLNNRTTNQSRQNLW